MALAAASRDASVDSVSNASADAGRIFLYFAPLTLLVYLVSPSSYFLDITTSYMLKNQLHATATQVSIFRLLTAVPIYFSFVFGLTRDLWNPLRLRDRGYFIIFAAAAAAVFAWMALTQLTWWGLFGGMLLVMLSFRFILAAHQGLIALIGQERLMSGRLSAVWQILQNLPVAAGAFASGWVAVNLPPSRTFMIAAALSLAIAALGFWKPRAVFNHTYDRPQAKGSDLVGDLRRLLKHRAVWPPVLIMLMFQFAPGANTPLQYYLSNTLHASDEIYGFYNAIFAASFIPMFFAYGWLCKHFSLKTLLWWGMALTVPQMIPLALIHSGTQALWLAVPIGMMGGIAVPAIYDLSIRSCPPGLQGTLMMMVASVYELSYRGGDLLGSRIYMASPQHGFLYCVIATTVVYALILPVLLLIPKAVIATADGEAGSAIEGEMTAGTGNANAVA
ncbi:MAG TPA: MFS transporter [Rhizomicrobium sp.]